MGNRPSIGSVFLFGGDLARKGLGSLGVWWWRISFHKTRNVRVGVANVRVERVTVIIKSATVIMRELNVIIT